MNNILKKILSVSLAVSIALPYLGFVSTADTNNINQKSLDTRGIVSNITKEISRQDVLDNSYKNNNLKNKTISKNKTLLNNKSRSWFDRLFEPSSAEELISEKDGYKIEVADMNWIVGDKVSSELLRKDLTNDDPFHLRAKLNISLNSKKDYNPGDIKITVPKYVFKDRDGNDTGTLTLAVPKYPNNSQDFAYQEEGKNIVIVNTKRINATTQAFFEFTIKNLVPHEIKDLSTGYKSAPFSALVEVTTDKGNKIYKKTGGVQAEINTRAVIDKVRTLGGQIYNNYSKNLPQELKPENPDDYIYVLWKTAATSSGNQPYRLDVDHDFTQGSNATGVKVLGYTKMDPFTDTKETVKFNQSSIKGVYEGFSERPYEDHAVVVYYVAYPKSNFKDGGHYDLFNYAGYRLTSLDDKETTLKTAWDMVTYRPVNFVAPTGHFIVEKGSFGSVSYGLSRLHNNDDVLASYSLILKAFGYNWTYEGLYDGGSNNPKNYGHKEYTVTTRDYGVEFNELKNLDTNDYDIYSVMIPNCSVWVYKRADAPYFGKAEGPDDIVSRSIAQGEWAYDIDKDLDLNVKILGKVGTSWIEYGVYNSKTKIIKPYNGASLDIVADYPTLKFPSGVAEFKLEYSTKVAAVTMQIVPKIRIKNSSPKIKADIDRLFKSSSNPKGFVRNHADLNFSANGETHFVNSDYADVKLSKFSYGSKLTSALTYKNQPEKKKIMLTYTGRMDFEVDGKNLNDIHNARNLGLLKEQTSCVWYDLLPKGVIPDVNSIKLRDEDKIESVDLVENYKNSGRILMKVHAKLSPDYRYRGWFNDGDTITGNDIGYDQPKITFNATYAWDELPDWGKILTNHMAYESVNDEIGNVVDYVGEPNTPKTGMNIGSRNMDKTADGLLTNLNPDRKGQPFLYASTTNTLTADIYSSTSLKKTVSVGDENSYSDGQLNNLPKNVYENGFYTYKVRLRNADASSNDNIIFYDKLDGYVPSRDTDDYGDFRWRGKFVGIDLSELEKAGIKPVVYYSTKENIVVDNMDNRSDNDLTKSNIWTKTRPTDKRITAIAVDARHKADGSDFELGVNKSISFTIKMQAPQLSKDDDAILDPALKTGDNLKNVYDGLISATESESGITGGAHAYNSIAMTFVSISNKDKVRTGNMLIKNEYTKVGLKKLNISVKKSWDDDNDRDGLRPKTLSFDLFDSKVGYSKTNVLDSMTVNKDSKWAGDFDRYSTPLDRNGNPIDFEIKETNKPNGYTFSVTKDKTTDSLVFKAVNKHKPEKISLPGVKTWDSGPQPQKITINLFANGNLLKSQDVIERDGEWAYSFDDLYKYENGEPIKYTVTEDPVEGYVPVYNEGNIDIHNKAVGYGSLKIEKTVKQSHAAILNGDPKPNNRDYDEFSFKVIFMRPDGSEDTGVYTYRKSNGRDYEISSGQFIRLRKDENAVIKDLPMGTKWTVVESEHSKYVRETVALEGDITNKTESLASFVNVYKDLTTLRGVKSWERYSEGNIPFSIKVKLYGDGKFIESKIVEEVDFTWSYIFEDVPKYNEKGELVKYTVREDPVDGYKPVYNEDNIDIYNKVAGYNLTINKIVKDENNQEIVGNSKVNKDIFTFTVLFKNSDGSVNNDTYTYEKSDGSQGQIRNGDTFTLLNKENIAIDDLPNGTMYEVKELSTEGYKPLVPKFTGQIEGLDESITFANIYKPDSNIKVPLTGKKGIVFGLLLGSFLILVSSYYITIKRKF